MLDASEIPPTFQSDPSQVVGIIAGGDAALKRSSEAKEDEADGPRVAFDEHAVNETDVVVGITAGGTTPYVWGALKLAKERNCRTALITCVSLKSLQQWERPDLVAGNTPTDEVEPAHRTSLPCEVDAVVQLPLGPEVITGSTRMLAGTATCGRRTTNFVTGPRGS